MKNGKNLNDKPTELERRTNRSRRKAERYLLDDGTALSTTITSRNSGDGIRGKLTDLSPQNCTFYTDNQTLHAIDDDIQIEIKAKENEVCLKGYIRTKFQVDQNVHRLGIQLLQDAPAIQQFINRKRTKTRRHPEDLYSYAKKFSQRLQIWKTQEHYHYHRSQANTEKIHLDFNSNDYLNLAADSRIKSAAVNALNTFGLGTAGPKIFSGEYDLHQQLAQTLAAIKKTEACLLCPSGFTANSGIFTSLITHSKTLLFLDEKDHASIFHGALGSKGQIKVFRHNDMDHLKKLLSQYEKSASKVICVDGVYSMDGDLAPLNEIHALARDYNASIWLDDAHSLGIFGENGRGIDSHFGLAGQFEIVTGSLSKTLGGFGGYVCASKAVVDYLDHLGREFVYTTTLPTAICSGLIKALDIILNECDERRNILWRNTQLMKKLLIENRFPVGPTESPIIPVIFKHESVAQQFAYELYKRGIDINSVTRPAVRRNEARLRITLRSDHTLENINETIEAMCAVRQTMISQSNDFHKFLFIPSQ